MTLGGITISGTKYLDLTGNGFSSDDTPQSGVTIDLYQVNGSGQPAAVRHLVASTTTASNGTYSFTVTSPGTYYVQESVPSGYIQTGGGPNGSAGNTYYTIVATSGHSYSGYNFDDFQIPTCRSHLRLLQGDHPEPSSTTVSDLPATRTGGHGDGHLHGAVGNERPLTLVSYCAPGSMFSDSTAYQQAIYQQAPGPSPREPIR